MLDFETPRALDIDEIPSIVKQYQQAAINAKQAGFDGGDAKGYTDYPIYQKPVKAY